MDNHHVTGVSINLPYALSTFEIIGKPATIESVTVSMIKIKGRSPVPNCLFLDAIASPSTYPGR